MIIKKPIIVEFYKNSQKRLAKVYTRIQKFGSKEILFDYLNRQLKKLVIQDYSSPIQNKSVPSQTSESEGEQNSSDQNSVEQSRPDQNSVEQSGSDENYTNKPSQSDTQSTSEQTILDNSIKKLQRNTRSTNNVTRTLRQPVQITEGFSDDCTFVFKRKCVLYLPYELGKMLGCVGAPNSEGYYRIAGNANSKIQATNKINLKACAPSTMLLYCNFISPSPTGNMLAPVLKVIPINKIDPKNPYTTYESEKLEFHELNELNLTNLEFQLNKIDGQKIDFFNPMHEIYFSLIFRRL